MIGMHGRSKRSEFKAEHGVAAGQGTAKRRSDRVSRMVEHSRS